MIEVNVLVEPITGNGFRATSGEPWRLESHAPTREQTLSELRNLIQSRMESGAEVVTLQLARGEHPLAHFAGILKGDPLLDEWKEAMAEYRRVSDPSSP